MGRLAPKSLVTIVTPVAVWIVTIGPVLRHFRSAGGVGGAYRTLGNHLFFFGDDFFASCRHSFTLALLPLLATTPHVRTDLVSLGWK